MENFETLQNVELEPCTSVDYDPLAIGFVKIEPVNGYNESDDRDAIDTSCNVFQNAEHLMTAKRPKAESAYFKHPSRGFAGVNKRPYERNLSVQAGKQQGSQSKLRRIVSDEGREMKISRKYSHNDVQEHALCLKLIELVKANPVIWSESSKHFLDINLKTAAWRQIAFEMRATVEMVKKKWSSLCAYFRKESSRVDNPNITESGRSDIYSSNWYAYESMQFLKEAANPRPTKSTLQQKMPKIIPEVREAVQEVQKADHEYARSAPGITTVRQPAQSTIDDSLASLKRKKKDHSDDKFEELFSSIGNTLETIA
uniref:MADF domain-containing protein n=1 Tax=Anopheles atroparvus TaxID=41427 RepID=A0AAG5DMH2_ANOAO